MTDKALTPKTDAAEFEPGMGCQEETVVNASFARALESELSAAHARIKTVTNDWLREERLRHEAEDRLTAAQQALDRYTRISELGESLGGQLEEMEARIDAQQENQRLREELTLWVTNNEALQDNITQLQINLRAAQESRLAALNPKEGT